MNVILISAGIVAIAEIGDKTQLLALLLATQFRKPLPIIAGIFFATVANHALAAFLGGYVADYLGPTILRFVLGVSFIAMGAWVLIPDKLDDKPKLFENFGAFGATLVSFFLVEIGDKTQIATVALAARFHDVLLVTIGTTLGMMLANVPVIYIGEFAAKKLPLKPIRMIAAGIFFLFGVLALAGVGV